MEVEVEGLERFSAKTVKEAAIILRDHPQHISEAVEQLKADSPNLDISKLAPTEKGEIIDHLYSLFRISDYLPPKPTHDAHPYKLNDTQERIVDDALEKIMEKNLPTIERILKNPEEIPNHLRRKTQRACFSILAAHYKKTDRSMVLRILEENKETLISLLKEEHGTFKEGEDDATRWWMIFGSDWPGNTRYFKEKEHSEREKEIIQEIISKVFDPEETDTLLGSSYNILVTISTNSSVAEVVIKSLLGKLDIFKDGNTQIREKLVKAWMFNIELNQLCRGEEYRWFLGAIRTVTNSLERIRELEKIIGQEQLVAYSKTLD